MKIKRKVLFLQGPTSTFWRELGQALKANGHDVHKINFHVGDWLYWRSFNASAYFGSIDEWEEYLDNYVEMHGITDILYYADRVPYHVVAARVGKVRGIRTVAIENGYLRPDWLTLELGGMAAHSHFPNDPEAIRRIAATLPEPDFDVRHSHKFSVEAVHEVTYNLSSYFVRWAFPRYHSDKYYNPLVDYVSFLFRLIRSGKEERRASSIVDGLLAGDAPFYVFPLQLQSDYQIRANSTFVHMSQMIEQVVGSFVAKAPQDSKLIFKLHPHDNGYENWPKVVRRVARRFGVDDRVTLIDGGDLNAMLGKAKGCILVNSTAGLHALRKHCPTKVLGIAVFDIPGLTHQGDLDSFWNAPEPVDQDLLDSFLRAMAASIQVKGSFYEPEGRKAAIAEIIDRMERNRINMPGCYVDPPPRLARARAMGVPCAKPEPARPAVQTPASVVPISRM
ncbi:capsule biosynthesis protein [Methyloraptor flagellatus]|jgi:capsular polysaccharide export protein|uniref:Capsular biosynthesis protein n=1 Tax=Methyloraptor flagellatus TaxID=3162530 RepID=A0AAU7X9A3_9HYPH